MRKRMYRIATGVAAAGVSIGGLAVAFNPMAQAAQGEIVEVGTPVNNSQLPTIESEVGRYATPEDCAADSQAYVEKSLAEAQNFPVAEKEYFLSGYRYYAYRCDQENSEFRGVALGEGVSGPYNPDGTPVETAEPTNSSSTGHFTEGAETPDSDDNQS